MIAAFCPYPRRRVPTGKGIEWFLLGRGREKWASASEAAALAVVSLATLSRWARDGCPQSIRVGRRVFYRRECLLNPACGTLDENPAAKERSPAEKAAEREVRRVEKERRRVEWIERRAARERHKKRVDFRYAVLMAYKARWQKSGDLWEVWKNQKKALKAKWQEEEALELGRDEMRFEGKPLDAPGAEVEAYGRGWKIIGQRIGKRLIGGA